MSEIVGVFGDSYAYSDQHQKAAWVDLLQNKFNYTINCYAYPATSLFWSYKQFMQHKDKCNKIIFTITADTRLYTRHIGYPMSNLYTIETLIQNNKDTLRTNSMYPILEAAKGYYKYLVEPEYCRWVHSKLIAEIIDICQKESKQLILIPTEETDIYCQNIFTMSLLDITTKELFFQFEDPVFRQETTRRSCHMSAKNNLIMATLLNDLLQGKQRTVSLSYFTFEKVDNPELYWTMK